MTYFSYLAVFMKSLFIVQWHLVFVLVVNKSYLDDITQLMLM